MPIELIIGFADQLRALGAVRSLRNFSQRHEVSYASVSTECNTA